MGEFASEVPYYIRLRRKIVWLLVAKLAALIVIYVSFFGPSNKAKITRQTLELHLFGQTLEPRKGVNE